MIVRPALLALLLTLAPGLAWADAFSSTPPAAAPPIATGVSKLAPLTNILTWKPLGSSLADFGTTTFTKTTGSPGIMVVEAPDDYDAVQLVFGSQTALDTYSVDGAVVSGSSTYGTAGKAPGTTPFNAAGTTLTTMTPVTFNNNGNCNLAPWAGTVNSFSTGVAGTTGSNTFSLLSSGAALGANSIPVASVAALSTNTAIDQSQQVTPIVGMFVTSGGGQIPANTKVATANATTITLAAAAVTTAAIAANEQLYFSYAPLTLTQAVAASTNPLQQQMTCSDWVQVSSYYRNDTVQVGDTVVSANFPGGTTVTAVGPQSATLSAAATSSTTGVSVAVGFTRTATTTVVTNPTYQFKYYVNSTTGIRKGMIVTGTSVPAGANVIFIGSDGNGPYVQLSAAPTASVAPGATLTFTSTCNTYLLVGVTIGDTVLNLVSTNSSPLLLLRVAATATGGNQVAAYSYSNNQLRLEGALGLRQTLMTRTASVNSVDIVPSATNTSSNGNWPFPIYAINFLTRHDGIQIDAYGDSQTAGLTTITGSVNFTRLAGESLSTPTKPVSVANYGYSGQSAYQFFVTAHQKLLSAAPPSILYMQGYTNNLRVDTPWSYQAKLQSLRRDAKAFGGKIIVGTQGVWGMKNPGTFNVQSAGTFTSGQTVTMQNAVPSVLTAIAVSGTGIPGSTTMTCANQTYGCTFSNTVTLTAGQQIVGNQIALASTLTAGTVATLSTPLPIGSGSIIGVSCSGCTAGALANGTANASTLTFTTTQTITAGTVLTLTELNNFAVDSNTGYALDRNMDGPGSGVTFFDYQKTLEDPNDPGFYLTKYSFDGVHAHELGQGAAAAAIQPLLQQMIGN